MKVILTADIKGKGKKGQVIEVSDGYARNFLFPRGLATQVTNAAMNDLKGKEMREAFHKEQELLAAKETAAKLSGKTVRLSARAGEGGRLFGSITSQAVADAIKMQLHVVIDKRKIVMGEGIKTIGETEVDIKVYPEISARIKVLVEEEG